MPLKTITLILVAINLMSCATYSSISDPIPPLELLSPGSLGREISLAHQVRIWVDETVMDMLVYGDIDASQIVIVGLLPNGLRLFTVIFDGKEIRSEGQLGPGTNIRPEYFLADFQLALWPLGVLRNHYLENSQCFVNTVCSLDETVDGTVRQVSVKKKPAITIIYSDKSASQKSIRIEHHIRGYIIDIITLNESAL